MFTLGDSCHRHTRINFVDILARRLESVLGWSSFHGHDGCLAITTCTMLLLYFHFRAQTWESLEIEHHHETYPPPTINMFNKIDIWIKSHVSTISSYRTRQHYIRARG
ncbi:uncharacterized protein BJX67DRAFT_25206 [Aspergillus lucknowensis]|uniref:Uncharacterized protein n=1 Tax=Aspergillus lucknowensis TaxID=176173 RepID=A0ABR4LXP3_9EURO